MSNTSIFDGAVLVLDGVDSLEHNIHFAMRPYAESSIDVVDGIIDEGEHF